MITPQLRDYSGRLAGGVHLFCRNPEESPEDYYNHFLEYLRSHRETTDAAISLESGRILVDERSDEHILYTVDDINGLFMQPFCPTVDEKGQVIFTDCSTIFDEALQQRCEDVLQGADFALKHVNAAAVACPAILTRSEVDVLRSQNCEVALSFLYLEARAAKVCQLPVAGLVLANSTPASTFNKVIECIAKSI